MQALKTKLHTFLRKQSAVLNIDLLYVTKGGFWLTIGHGLSLIASLLLSVAFAHLVSKEVFGTYRYILSIVGMLSIFSLPGINTSLSRSIAQGYGGAIDDAFKSKLTWSLLGSFASLGTALYYYIQGNTVLGLSFLIVALFIGLIDACTVFSSVLQGTKDFQRLTYINTLVQYFSLAVMACALFVTEDIPIIMLAYFASWTIGRALALIYTIRISNLPPTHDPQVLHYGKHLSLMNVVSTLAAQADKILLFHYFGAAELAVYSFAQALPEQIRSIFRNVNILAFPNFSNRSGAEIKQRLASSNRYFVLLMCAVFVAYLLVAPYIFKFLFPQYVESIFLSQLYALVLILTPKMLYRTALEAKGRNKELYTLHIVSAVSKIILLSVGIYIYGIIGAIIAAIIHEVFLYGLLWWLVYKSKDFEA